MTAPRLTAALVDRYRIERELGAGGMATVYLASDGRILAFVNADEESSPVIRIITNFPEFRRQKERQSQSR